MALSVREQPLSIVVGSGGVGKTTLAAALGLVSARAGFSTLVMTFDPSLRLKDALGVGLEAKEDEVLVATDTPGTLHASLLDARRTFDRLVARHAPSPEARDRILHNRYYDHLAGNLAGILEYMAVERLYEVSSQGRYDRIILDTPPTRQAIDFLQAPQRIVEFLDSGALRIALKAWFDEEGHLRPTRRFGFVGRTLESFLDRIVGMQLLREMSEFFQAFGPLFEGFRGRARRVEELLGAAETGFLLVTGPGEERIPDTLFFARRLQEAGYRLGPVVVNRVHPRFPASAGAPDASELEAGRHLFHWLGERHTRGLVALRKLLPASQVVVEMPLEPDEPTSLAALTAMGERFEARLREARGG